jgi:ubiquinone/menaquinone biosynthesis C-methylase UbiE
MPWLFDQLALPAACRVLELGAGPGDLWRKNAGRIPPGGEVTLSDLSPGMVETARGALAAVPHPFAFAMVDAQAIPFPDATFDVVIASFMLYHVPDRSRALAEIRRVLTPGDADERALERDHE